MQSAMDNFLTITGKRAQPPNRRFQTMQPLTYPFFFHNNIHIRARGLLLVLVGVSYDHFLGQMFPDGASLMVPICRLILITPSSINSICIQCFLPYEWTASLQSFSFTQRERLPFSSVQFRDMGFLPPVNCKGSQGFQCFFEHFTHTGILTRPFSMYSAQRSSAQFYFRDTVHWQLS